MRKKFAMKTLFQILAGGAVIIMLSFLQGCGLVSENTSDVVIGKLNEKYDQEFISTNIGDRYNTDAAKLFCYPKDNERVHFTVEYDYKNKTISDDYICRFNAVKIDDELQKALNDSSMSGATFTRFWNANNNVGNIGENISDFIKEADVEELYINSAIKVSCIKSEDDMQCIIDIVKTLSLKYDNIKVLFSIYTIPDDSFEKCFNDMQVTPYVNDSWVRNYNYISETSFILENGVPNATAEKLVSDLKR